jgi:hypothetical protein
VYAAHKNNEGRYFVKKYLIIGTIVSALFITTIIHFFGIGKPPIALGNNFVDSVYGSILINEMVDFENMTDFEWDRMLVIPPYSDFRKVLENNNIRQPARFQMSTDTKYSDHAVLLVFVSENRVAAYIDYPISKGSFRAATTEGIDKSEARFISKMDEWGWATLHHKLTYETITDPDEIARHELSLALFPDARGMNILEVPPYEDNTLPPYITVEIASISLFQGNTNEEPKMLNESWSNANYSSGSLIGLYSGQTTYVRSTSEYIGDGWWAVASWWEGTLNLRHTGTR